jgi:hypothetical protein
MSLSEKQVELVDKIYRDASLGLLTPQAINKYLKDNGPARGVSPKIHCLLYHGERHFPEMPQHRGTREEIAAP